MDNNRRNLIKAIASFAALLPLAKSFSATSLLADSLVPNITLKNNGVKNNAVTKAESNFHFIYDNAQYKANFYQFLVNVFNLYPELELHQLIDTSTAQLSSDQDIYLEVQSKLNDISSLLAPFTYVIPALNKQKQEIADQTQMLLGDTSQFNGYLEIGSTGRYLDELEERFNIEGERYFLTDKSSTYSPTDMIDRGQVFKAGTDIAFNNYQPDLTVIPNNSIDLVTIYIGFHHCPIPLRQAFITSIYRVMSDGAFLIVRDHDVINSEMYHTVSLAHDVFNAGTKESWGYNNDELRNFYSLAELDILLTNAGFTSDGTKLFQTGDPTLNALMLYQKI